MGTVGTTGSEVASLTAVVQSLSEKVDILMGQRNTPEVMQEAESGPLPAQSTSRGEINLATLQDDAALKYAVNKRFNELVSQNLVDQEDSDDEEEEPPLKLFKGRNKSGKMKTALDSVVRKVDWPHYHVFRAGSAKSVKYDDLSLSEFVFGYCCQVLELLGKEGASSKISRRLEHLRDLMEDTSDFSFDQAKAYHAIVLNRFEQARV